MKKFVIITKEEKLKQVGDDVYEVIGENLTFSKNMTAGEVIKELNAIDDNKEAIIIKAMDKKEFIKKFS